MFELHITCTKEIDELRINFSDGTSTISSRSDNNVQSSSVPHNNGNNGSNKPKKQKEPEYKSPTLDLDTDYSVSAEVVQKPEIVREDKPIKVSPDLQNMEF